MTIRRKIKIIIGQYGIWIAILALFAFFHLIPSQEAVSLLGLVYLVIIMIGADFLLSNWLRKYLKLMKNLPGDYKLIREEMSSIEIGNIRFNYSVRSKAINNKTDILAMFVQIPFPINDETVKSSMKQDLKELMKELQNDAGYVISCDCLIPSLLDLDNDNSNEDKNEESDNNDANDVEYVGWPLQIVLNLKKTTEESLSLLQDRLLSIVKQYGLNDYVLCTAADLEDVTNYYQNVGNIEVSSIQVQKDSNKRICFSCRRNRRGYIHKNRDLIISQHEYQSLFDITRKIQSNLDIDSIEPAVKNIIGSYKKDIKTHYSYGSEGACVVISPRNNTTPDSKFFIIESYGLWWVYATAPTFVEYPISLENESDACYLLLVMIEYFVNDFIKKNSLAE